MIEHVARGEGIAEIVLKVTDRGAATEALTRLGEELLAGGMRRLYVQAPLIDADTQRVAIAAGYTREGVARGAGRDPGGRPLDLVVWARVAGDPPGPSPRALPDLPGGALTDGVVVLRPLTADDGDSTYRMRILPEVSGRSVVGTPMDPAAVARQCAESQSRWLEGRRAECTIRRAGDDAYLGEIALYYSEPVLREAMIGYSLSPDARGQGYASRAATLLTDWGFEIGMVRMIAGTAPDNVASQRVLERAGYRREALEHGKLPGPDGTRIDNVAFAKLRPAAT